MMMTPKEKHRTYEEVTRQILHFLYLHGPSSILQIEYAVEINTRQTKGLIPSLLATNLIIQLSPDQRAFKKAQRTNAVARLFKITSKGKKCMDLMNKMAEHLNTPIDVQYNIRRGGYFLSSTDSTLSKT